MHRTTTRRDLLFISCVLALFALASCAALTLDNPSLRIPVPPAKTLAALHSKPTLPGRAEEVKLPIPLDDGLVSVLVEACEAEDVPLELAVAVMEQESGFTVDAVGWDGHDIGLFQLRDTYHWWLTEQTGADPMTPEGNIRCGVWLLGYRLEEYGDTAAALTAYRWGHDNGSRTYANEVLVLTEHWKERLEAMA